jgi:hypothetical protein
MIAFIGELHREKMMLNDFENVNRILAEMRDEGLIEPIDDPSIQTDFYDWADVVGVSEEIEPDTVFSVDDYREDFHSDDAVGFVAYGEDGPYYD